MAKNKEKKITKIKVTPSVEKDIKIVADTIVKIYSIKENELMCKVAKLNDNSEKNRENLNAIQVNLREVLNTIHYQIKALFENPEYEGREFRTNYNEEFINKEPKSIRRYTYFDMERLLREDYYFCKNSGVRKAVKKVVKASRKFSKASNNYTKKTNLKKTVDNYV